MTEILTAAIIFVGSAIVYFLGFLTAALLSSAYRSEIEVENQLLAGKNAELELEIAVLKGDKKILRFNQEENKIEFNNQ